jgi:hypothetical protein
MACSTVLQKTLCRQTVGALRVHTIQSCPRLRLSSRLRNTRLQITRRTRLSVTDAAFKTTRNARAGPFLKTAIDRRACVAKVRDMAIA